jgi:death on curing protein
MGSEVEELKMILKTITVWAAFIKNHPFIDGNKRTAITATGVFLRRNGALLTASQDELYDFTMKMAEGKAGQVEAEAWLQMHNNSV